MRQDDEQAVSRIGPRAGSAATGQVVLEPLSAEHAEATVAWLEDPEVAGGLGLRREPSLAGTLAWIDRANDDATFHPFAILAGGAHVGNVVLDLLDEYLSTARLSIYVGDAAARGAGVGQQAVRQVADHAADVLGLHKLWLTVHVGNARALAAYVRCGFLVEGVLRDEFILEGDRIDVMRMGLLLNAPSR